MIKYKLIKKKLFQKEGDQNLQFKFSQVFQKILKKLNKSPNCYIIK